MDSASRVQTGGLVTEHVYNKYGFPTEQITKKGTILVSHYQYNWNLNTAQLISRSDLTNPSKVLTEQFSYDNDRLSEVRSGTGVLVSQVNYDQEGASRIQSKSDAGVYTYNDQIPINTVKELFKRQPPIAKRQNTPRA